MSSNVDHARVAPGATGVDPNHLAAAKIAIVDADAGVVDILGDRKKIAICGFASSTRHLMPVHDLAWVVTGMNQLYRHLPRADFWFDIHKNWEEGNVEGTDHPRALREIGFPVFMVERTPLVPNSVRFPIERILAKFGIDYFTSTVSYMIALAIDAIDAKVERRLNEIPQNGGSIADAVALARSIYAEYTIGIFGIDLIVGDEYDFQKACVEFWIGEADARGIEVTIPPASALLKQRWRYGYESEPDGGVIKVSDLQLRQREIEQRMQKAQEIQARAVAELQTLDGARQELAHHLTVIDLRLKGGIIPLSNLSS